MPLRVPAPVRPLLDRFGARARRLFVAAYAREHAIDRVRLEWHEVLHMLHLLVRVARTRVGAAAPLLFSHPWEVSARASTAALAAATGVLVVLPERVSGS
jgi:hypothetical protein